MKIKKNTIKKFMSISAATLLILSIGGSIINSTSHDIHADNFDDILNEASTEGPSKSDIADEQEQYDNSLKDSIKHPKNINDNELVMRDNWLFYYNSRYHKREFKQAVKQGLKQRKRSLNDVYIDRIAKNAIGRGPYIAIDKDQYAGVLNDVIKYPKELSIEESILQGNPLFHKKSFERTVKQGIKQRNHKNTDDTFTKFVKTMSNQGPTKSDIADEQVQYNNVLKDSIKHPKEMKANETILQDNYLFHKKSYENTIKRAIHKRSPRVKQNHKAKQQPKRKQVKTIRNSLKRINLKINRVAHHKYRTKRTKRNAKRYLNRLRNECRKYEKQLNSINHKQYTKRYKRNMKHHVRRHRSRSNKYLRK